MNVAAEELAGRIGQTAEACETLGVSRSTLYRRRRPVTSKPKRRPRPQRALDTTDRERVLSALHCERFDDKAPAQVWATLLDEGIYHCSIRTMYRILSEHGEVRERWNQLRHPNYQKPELVAEAPNQVWSWDITKLRGPVKWTYFYLYVILDIFSRYVTGWMLARRESAELARRLISESCLKQNIEADQLTIHADRGSSMRSKSVALLLADLGITKTHSRPYVSNDNPYSESQFKTMKYCPEFPSRFGCLEDGRLFCGGFFDYYNNAHRHSGLGLMTPAAVHYGRADELNAARRQVLLEAHRAHPERFVHGTPQPPVLPRQVWINPPPEKTTPQEALGATFSGRPIPELPTDSSYPDAIASEPNRRPHRAHAPSFTDRGSLNAACGCLKVVDTFRGGVQDRLHFIDGEMIHQPRLGLLLRNGEDSLDLFQGRGQPVLEETHERLNRSEACVARARAVVSFVFEVFQETQYEGLIDVFHIKLARLLVESTRGEFKK